MYFPQYLKDQRRWVVRPKPLPGLIAKQPQSALADKPEGYVPKYPDERDTAWRYRWNQQCILVDFQTAVAYQQKHSKRFESVGFILHHFNRIEEDLRLVVIDLDHAYVDDDPTKGLLPRARETVEQFKGKCFMEDSRSGKGVHIWILTRCMPFKNHRAKFEFPLAYDCLCASHVAVTGRVFEGQTNLEEIDFECLEWQSWFENDRASETVYGDVSFKDWWDAPEPDPVDTDSHIAKVVASWPEAIKDQGRSNTAIACAVRLMEYGIIGKEAVEHLRHLRTDVEFSEADLRHKVESAFTKAMESEKFGTRSVDPVCEFDVIAPSGEPPKPPPKDFGIEVFSIAQLSKMDLTLKWLVEGVFVDDPKEVTFFGGREKTFKTGIMMDFFISIATGKPFLGSFDVVTRKRVVFATSEIGKPSIQALARRVCESKGVDWGSIDNMFITTHMPTFSDKESMKAFKAVVFDKYKPEAIGYDPAYLGAAGIDISDMFKFAQVMQPVRELGADCGAQSFFAHHAKMSSGNEIKKDEEDYSRPMKLHDLYGAGFAAFARQWLLLSHAAAYRKGVAKLWCSIGGSAAGPSPLVQVHINEGEANRNKVDSRKWDISVVEWSEDDFSEVEIMDLRSFVIWFLGEIPRATAKDVHLASKGKVEPDASAIDVKSMLDGLRNEELVTLQGDGYLLLRNEELVTLQGDGYLLLPNEPLTQYNVSDIL